MSGRSHDPGMASRPAASPDIEVAERAPLTIPVVTDSSQSDGSAQGAGSTVDAVHLLAPVIRSKIQPPQWRTSTLSRRRLLNALTAAIAGRVTLVVAEAGYGKSTLLTDFSASSATRCLWYKLDSTDQDWVTLVNYLIASAREVEPDFGSRTSQLLASDPTTIPPRQAVLASLMAELQELGDVPTAVILDDFQAIDESAEACDVITRLIRDTPTSFSFVISSRRQPPLLLARLAGMGELRKIGTEDLRFSLEETRQLFSEGYQRPLEPDVLDQIDARTKGWAVTLQLLYSSIRDRPDHAVRSLARSISGADGRIYDFLAEEVLGRLSNPMQEFVIRASLLEGIVPAYVVALSDGEEGAPGELDAANLIEEADALGIVSRTSQTSDARQFHPLLRDFLLRQLGQRFSGEVLRAMHARVARTAAAIDPLVACHHYIEAGETAEAMKALAMSAMLTMGSGRWGTAAELIGRLQDAPADPVVAAIQARRLLEDGDVSSAATILEGIDVSGQPPAARAVFRHTKLSLGWRSRDSAGLFATLREIEEDKETPPLLREIAQVFVDASPLSPTPVTFPTLSQRLQRMADRQARAGHSYYAAISLHNAAIAELNAGRFREAIRLGRDALTAFDRLAFDAVERYSTYPILAAAALELEGPGGAEDQIRAALASGSEEGDVHAACAYSLAVIGERERSMRLLLSAEALERQGRSDLQGAAISLFVRSFLQLPTNPAAALAILGSADTDSPLDLGFNLERHTLSALAHLMGGDRESSLKSSEEGLADSRKRNGLRSEVRLAIVQALAGQNRDGLKQALSQAAAVGHLAILELADALAEHLDLLPDVPTELSDSIARWKNRWLPLLRGQLGRGNTASAHVAARLLDEHGAIEDVPRLRAFEKTYLRRSRGLGLGKALAKKVSHTLDIQDLGRVILRVGERSVPLSHVRRKPASLLMYLVTRPNFTATREQIIEDLWPESDPMAALNSLNQSLYFLRREIDPWYEDDVSADYIPYEGELVWLDAGLVRSASAEFVSGATDQALKTAASAQWLALIGNYAGQFSPEFEYEEWAMSWRSRVHASFLEFAHTAVARSVDAGDLQVAREIATRTLAVDPSASDIEHKLIWLYWHLGMTSAAAAQYQHMEGQHRADGLEPPPLDSITAAERP
jgi:DNA-binding SARP family transcriptional activator